MIASDRPNSSPSSTPRRTHWGAAILVMLGLGVASLMLACHQSLTAHKPQALDPAQVAKGKTVFRFETFDDERFWTDTARLHEVVQSSVSPVLALQVGLKVDVDTLPQAVRDAIAAKTVDLNSPATTVTLLKLGAVVGIKGTVETVNGKDTLVSARHHMRALSLHRRQFLRARYRPSIGRLAESRLECRRDRRALAGDSHVS